MAQGMSRPVPNSGHCRGAPSQLPLPSLSLVLPMHNEEALVERVAEAAVAAVASVTGNPEVLVVDDGSADETGAGLRWAQRRWSTLRVLTHRQNRGYGAALSTGLAAARGQWVALCDGDAQFDLSQLADLVRATAHAEAVIGYRSPRHDGALRVLLGRGWTWLVNTALATGARDVNCGFKLFHRRLLPAMLPLHSTGAGASAELLWAAQRQGARVAEVPLRHRPRVAGDASGARIGVMAGGLRDLVALRRLSAKSGCGPCTGLARETLHVVQNHVGRRHDQQDDERRKQHAKTEADRHRDQEARLHTGLENHRR